MERVPLEGGVVLAFNHVALDRPARGRRRLAAHGVLHGEAGDPPCPGPGPADPRRSGRSRCGAARATGRPSGSCARSSRRARRSGLFVEGTRQKRRSPARCSPGAAMVGAPGGRAGRVRRDLRRLTAGGPSGPCRSRGASRCASTGCRRAGRGYREASARDPGGDQAAVGMARRDPRGRTTRDGDTAGVSGGPAAPGAPGHGGDRRLPERRQVDPRQPADRDADGRRPRDARGDARPEGARVRVGRARASSSSTPAGSTSADAVRDHAADRRAGPRGGRGGRPRALRRRREAGITPGDEEIADILRRSHKPVLLSRTRWTTRRATRRSTSSTGSGSATRSRSRACTGTAPGDLLDEVVERLRELAPSGRPRSRTRPIRVAILGRPNVGKSSLLNALSARSASIVSEVPGRRATRSTRCCGATRRRSCSSTRPGMRRKRQHRQGIEYYSELRALEAAERADVALVLVDAAEGIVEQDLAVADVARKAAVLDASSSSSKWDVTERPASRTCGRELRPAPAPAPAGDRRLGEDRPRHRRACSTRSRSCSPSTRRAISTRRAEPLPRASCARRAARRREGGRRLNLLYGAQVADAAAALPLLRQRPGPRHARLRLLGREPAPRALRARGRAGVDRLRAPIVRVGRRRRRARGGRRSPRSSPTAATRSTLACRDAEQARAIARDRPQPALPRRRSTCAASRRRRSRRRRSPRPTSSSSRSRAASFGEVVGALPGDGAGAEPDEGARPGHRRAALDARPRPAGRRALRARTWPRRSPRACRRRP